MDPPRTAAALVIGNELLTGKVRDQNLPALATMLFDAGIVLSRAVFCLDDEGNVVAVLGERANTRRGDCPFREERATGVENSPDAGRVATSACPHRSCAGRHTPPESASTRR